MAHHGGRRHPNVCPGEMWRATARQRPDCFTNASVIRYAPSRASPPMRPGLAVARAGRPRSGRSAGRRSLRSPTSPTSYSSRGDREVLLAGATGASRPPGRQRELGCEQRLEERHLAARLPRAPSAARALRSRPPADLRPPRSAPPPAWRSSASLTSWSARSFCSRRTSRTRPAVELAQRRHRLGEERHQALVLHLVLAADLARDELRVVHELDLATPRARARARCPSWIARYSATLFVASPM